MLAGAFVLSVRVTQEGKKPFRVKKKDGVARSGDAFGLNGRSTAVFLKTGLSFRIG
jgi:hypothetical protein